MLSVRRPSMLRPPDNARAKERIQLYGDTGAGKSYFWMTIAELANKTGSDAQFHVIDSDRDAALAIGPGGEFEHLAHRIHVHEVFEVEEYLEAGKLVKKEAGPDDWVVVDRLSPLWETLPGWWISRVFQEDEADYWTTMRKVALGVEEGEKGFGGMKEGVDWQFLNKVHDSFEVPLSMGGRFHMLVTADEKEVVDRYDKSGKDRAKYSVAGGVKPAGQKHTPKRFHTLVRVKRVGDDIELVMVRDRHLEHVWKEKAIRGRTIEVRPGPVGGAMALLKKMHGWRL